MELIHLPRLPWRLRKRTAGSDVNVSWPSNKPVGQLGAAHARANYEPDHGPSLNFALAYLS